MSSSSGTCSRPVGQVKGERPAGEAAPVRALATARPIIWPPYQMVMIAGRLAASHVIEIGPPVRRSRIVRGLAACSSFSSAAQTQQALGLDCPQRAELECPFRALTGLLSRHYEVWAHQCHPISRQKLASIGLSWEDCSQIL